MFTLLRVDIICCCGQSFIDSNTDLQEETVDDISVDPLSESHLISIGFIVSLGSTCFSAFTECILHVNTSKYKLYIINLVRRIVSYHATNKETFLLWKLFQALLGLKAD